MDKAQVRELVNGRLKESPFRDWAETLVEIARPCVRFIHTSRDSLSHLGGEPRLPAYSSWPIDADGDPLAFVAAIDLEDIPASVDEDLHNYAGVLSFLYDSEGQAWGERDQEGNWSVIHTARGVPTVALSEHYPTISSRAWWKTNPWSRHTDR